MKPPRATLVGLLGWWLGIGVVGAVVGAVLIDHAYSRTIYLFVVMPVAGVLLFPIAYAANRWMSPALRLRLKL
jgi:hypothetical protein